MQVALPQGCGSLTVSKCRSSHKHIFRFDSSLSQGFAEATQCARFCVKMRNDVLVYVSSRGRRHSGVLTLELMPPNVVMWRISHHGTSSLTDDILIAADGASHDLPCGIRLQLSSYGRRHICDARVFNPLAKGHSWLLPDHPDIDLLTLAFPGVPADEQLWL